MTTRWSARIVLLTGLTFLISGPGCALQATTVAHAERSAAASAQAPTFLTNILPIFQANCLRCHDSKTKSGGLNLSTQEGVLAGGSSGSVVVPKNPGASRLYDAIHSGMMPLDRKTKVSAADTETIRLWIESLSVKLNQPVAPLTQHSIIPIMLRHCTPCHGFTRQEAALDLRTRASMVKGGKSGPALVPGDPSKSLMVQKIESREMPPKDLFLSGVTPLVPAETEKLKQWIAQGAPEGNVQPDVAGTSPDPLVSDHERKFWAFQPPQPAAIPQVQHSDRVRNAIDAFILQKLEAKGLTLSPEADRLTLIRRVYFDLTGLPPTPAEVQAFLDDKNPEAYENLVDRLLASARYGERWGRFWLDLAGYSDSEDRDSGHRREAWRYRDYVIRCFNADKPYNRFLLEQIAGDELEDYEHAAVITQQMMDNLIATGFLRMTPDPTGVYDMTLLQDRINVVSDEMQVFSSAVMGLTVQCAQCHDHKLEPIPQRDYYRLRAVFKGALDEYEWLAPMQGEKNTLALRRLPYATPMAHPIELVEEEQHRQSENERIGSQIKELQAALDKKAKPLKDKLLDARLAAAPPEIHDALRLMLVTALDKRSEQQKRLADQYELKLTIEPDDLKELDPDYRKAAEQTEKQILVLRSQLQPDPYIRALWDRGEPSPTYIYGRGDVQNPGRLVGPGVPSVLTNGSTPFVVTPPWPGAHKTGARLALARWLITPENPLTARVWVNRIWQHHFGRGIVATAGNFGKSGDPPSHPELLDWLAVQLMQQGWSTKAIQRLIMTSSTYRQVSKITPSEERLDSGDVLLSRMPMTRMDGETLRDSVLFVAGRLDETRYGPPDLLYVREDGLVTAPETAAGWRRSIYAEQRREDVMTTLDLFDYPQMTPNCISRTDTAVAPQALHLLNDTMIRQLADSLSQRVRKEVGDDLAKQIDRVYWLALDRPPTVEEKSIVLTELNNVYRTKSGRILSRYEVLARFCDTIINSAAFIYID